MKKIAFITVAFSFLFTTGLFFSIQHVSAQEKKCLECHKAMTKGMVVHKALQKGCSSCHRSPHAGGSPTLSLTSEEPDLCYDCHRAGNFRRQYQHDPVARGKCTSCHNPHSSRFTGLTSLPRPVCARSVTTHTAPITVISFIRTIKQNSVLSATTGSLYVPAAQSISR
jgi:predicted CXXCH cytochrome family protein